MNDLEGLPASPPAEISQLVRQRTEARQRRDWSTADILKAQIEAAGWKVVDRADRTSVTRAAPPQVEVEGEIRYGSAGAVPSLLEEPATAPWTVCTVASEDPDRIARLLAALREHAPAGTQVVVVANDPSQRQATELLPEAAARKPVGGREIEVIRTSTRLGYAAALNVALRRCAGELVLLADGSAWPAGDALTPLARALEDPEVAEAGGLGVVSRDRRLRPAGIELSKESSVLGLLGSWLAFRRSDLIALGPLDEHFVIPAWLDLWWSLRLRMVGPAEAEPSRPVRRALRLDLPLEFEPPAWPPDRSRLARRNMYRVLDRFGPGPNL
jgi:hypothetical protein